MLPSKFAKIVKRAVAQNELLFKKGGSAAAAHVLSLQKQVRDALVMSKGFEASHLAKINAELKRIGATFDKSLASTVAANQDAAWKLGAGSVADGLKAAVGIDLAMLPTELLVAAKDYAAELITDLSKELIEKISADIRTGVVLGENPYETMVRVERHLFKDGEGAFFRAETIVRTENNRIFGIANQERLSQAAKDLPKLRKIWVASSDERTRDSHYQASIDYSPGGDPGPIPVDQPFIVDGQELMFPGDPMGEARLVINCRCVSEPYIADWDAAAKDVKETLKEGGPGSGRYPSGSGDNPKQSAFADKSPDEMHAYIQKQYKLDTSLSVVPKLPVVRLPDGTKFRPEARTNVGTGEVECSEALFMRTGDDTSIGYKSSGSIEMGGWQAIVCHETAHVLDASRDIANSPQFLKLHAAMETAPKSKSGFVSQYAMNSPEENFAESFAVYKLQPAWLEKNNPDMYNFIRKIK